MFKSYWAGLMFLWLLGHAPVATAVSEAPLQAISAYIEHSGACPAQLVEWNREYGRKTIVGETHRTFYYRVLSYAEWKSCGRPFFRSIFDELLKVSMIFARGLVLEAEFEAKEAELVNLLFAAMKDEVLGEQMVRAYERRTTARLFNLEPPQRYFNCTFFGEQPRCMD